MNDPVAEKEARLAARGIRAQHTFMDGQRMTLITVWADGRVTRIEDAPYLSYDTHTDVAEQRGDWSHIHDPEIAP